MGVKCEQTPEKKETIHVKECNLLTTLLHIQGKGCFASFGSFVGFKAKKGGGVVVYQTFFFLVLFFLSFLLEF